jgi:AcrR family transcriptional regulator
MAIGKRDRTRSKLLVAAQELALEGGAGALTVYNLTERAEVALGTFYNYYRTREDVLDDVCDLLVLASRQAVTQAIDGLEDLRAVVATSVRQTLHLAAPGQGIGHLLFDANLPTHRFILGMRHFFKRDLEAGINSGAFEVGNEAAVISMVSGSSYGVMQDLYQERLEMDMIDDVAEMMLRALGVNASIAAVQARLPIDFKSPPPLPLIALDLLPPLATSGK